MFMYACRWCNVAVFVKDEGHKLMHDDGYMSYPVCTSCARLDGCSVPSKEEEQKDCIFCSVVELDGEIFLDSTRHGTCSEHREALESIVGLNTTSADRQENIDAQESFNENMERLGLDASMIADSKLWTSAMIED